MAGELMAGLIGGATSQIARELVDELRKMNDHLDVLRGEWAQRKATPAGPVAWDDLQIITVPAAQTVKDHDFQTLFGRGAVQLRVISAPTGASLRLNGGDAFEPVTGMSFEHGRIHRIQTDNTAGGDQLVLAVALIATKATGGGAWA